MWCYWSSCFLGHLHPANDGAGTWLTATYMRGLDGVPIFWLQAGPAWFVWQGERRVLGELVAGRSSVLSSTHTCLSDVYNGQVWAWPKLEPGTPISVSNVGSSDPSLTVITCCILVCICK